MSESVLFGKAKDPELVVWNFCGQEGILEDLGVVEEFRNHEKGIEKNTREGCPTRCRRPRVPDGEKNDSGDDHPHGSLFSTRESHGGETAKRIHGRHSRKDSLDTRQLCISTRVKSR